MADKTKIEWSDATKIVDRNGRRTRLYKRLDPSRPSQQLRRAKLKEGFKWCRGCKKWLEKDFVGKNGLCRTHENEDARIRYANSPKFNAERKAHSYRRKRGVEKVPEEAAELILELFNNECAYCDGKYESFDHVIPVSKGGKTEPGNILPSCKRCNSRKKNMDIEKWLDRAPSIKPMTIEYLSMAGVI